MFFFNLSALEFLALLSGVSSVVVVLYLLDRSRKKQVVSTLRFWQQSEMPTRQKHRRKIQQPWSLLLQLLGLALLLLAIAQLRWGSAERSSRDHVLLVDGSSWMSATGAGGRLMLEEAKELARRYLRTLPVADRVMLVRVDGLATPLTGFEERRQIVEEALARMEPGLSGLSLGPALEFAARVLEREARRRGEIVYAGAGRMSQEGLQEMRTLPGNLRFLPVGDDMENCGLRKVSVRRAPADPEVWQVFVSVRNYGKQERRAPFVASFGGAPVHTKQIRMAPGAEASIPFEFRSKGSGWVEARLEIEDAVAGDNRATVELPEEPRLKVAVYSAEPELLRPVMRANPRMEVEFRRPSEWKPDVGQLVLDRFAPPGEVQTDALWIEPPAGAPVGVAMQGVRQNAALRWRTDQELATGLRTRDLKLERVQVFGITAGDVALAEVDGGAAIVARAGARKTAVFGFHPMRSAMKYELATPLLFANVLRWMAPDLFVRVERQAGSVGTVTLPLENGVSGGAVRVTVEGRSLPFTLRDGLLRFYSALPGTVRVTMGERELVSTLGLPELGEARWEAPATVARGFRGVGGAERAVRDLWYWLAVLGAVVLAGEWILYGRKAAGGRQGVRRIPFLSGRREERRMAS